MTLQHSSLEIALIAAVIVAFRSGIVWELFPNTLPLRYPHRQKSGVSSPVNAAAILRVTPAADESVRETLL